MGFELKKLIKLMVVLILVVFVATGCNFNTKPEVNLTAEIVKLTDEDYNSVGTTGITSPSKSDFRKFNFRLKVNNLNNIKERTITIPKLEEAINAYDNKNRLWFGSSTEQDNSNEDFAIYERKDMLFTRGLDDTDIRKMFENKIVSIKLETDEGEIVNKQFDVGKSLKFR